MRVITFLTTVIVVVTSFAIRRHANSVDDDPLRYVFDELESQIEQLQHRVYGNLTGDIALRINDNGMKYLVQQLISSIRHDANRHAPTTITTAYHGMKLTIESIQITTFNAPTIHFESDDSFLKIILKGGRANLLGQYTAKYRTNREGQMDVSLEDIDAEIEVDLSERKVSIEDVKCSHSIGVAEVKLTPVLPAQISQQLKDELIERIAGKICPSLKNYLLKTVRMAKKAVRIEEPLQEDDSIVNLIPHNILAATVSDKGAEIVFERSSGSHHNILPPRESFAMGSVTLSAAYINDFLFDLAEKGDIIFHLDRIPEIHQQLRLKCDDDTLCIGTVAKLPGAVNGTGHLEAKAIVAPKLEVHNGVALLKWKLLTTMTYFNTVIGRRAKYLQFNQDILLNVEDLKFEAAEEEGRYNWKATYKILKLEVSRVATFFDEVESLAGIVPSVMENNREEIEQLINDHLTAMIPVQLNSHIHLLWEATQYQENQLTFEFNFKTDRKLFPSFDFS